MTTSQQADSAKDDERAVYSVGDYTWLAKVLMPAAEDLVEACDVGSGDRVLDVAAGTGNVAVAAARRGAEVTAVDITPAQVQLGQARTAAEDLPVSWLVGDAEKLPVADRAFTHVLSAFGVMYAPRPDLAAAELRRAVQPDGTIGLVAWPPDGFNDRLGEAVEALLGPSDEDASDDASARPSDWGDPVILEKILGQPAICAPGTVTMEAKTSDALWEDAAAHIGVLVTLRSELPAETFAALGRSYAALVEAGSVPYHGGIRFEVPYVRAISRL